MTKIEMYKFRLASSAIQLAENAVGLLGADRHTTYDDIITDINAVMALTELIQEEDKIMHGLHDRRMIEQMKLNLTSESK